MTVSGMEDTLLYIASSEAERQLCMHVLEIVSLMFREQVFYCYFIIIKLLFTYSFKKIVFILTLSPLFYIFLFLFKLMAYIIQISLKCQNKYFFVCANL